MIEALRIFWDWWRARLLELVPGEAARREVRADDGLILADPAAGTVGVTERAQGNETMLGRLALDPATAEGLRGTAQRRRWPMVLRLPGALLLEREVGLPLAAERDLGRVLFHEMDRVTPFAAAEVVWAWTMLARDRQAGRLTLRLSVVPRAAIEPAIGVLRDAGLAVSDVELPGPDGRTRRIPLAEDAAVRTARQAPLVPALAIAAVVLLVAAVAVPFVLQARTMDAVQARIAASAPTVARVQKLRHDLAASATGTQVVANERHRAGDALEAIALLTQALPGDTYLTSLNFDAGRATLDGQSRSAAALIAPLAANPRLQDASFTAPVVRNTVGLDSFSMRLGVRR